jgi:hypothetical protein
MLSGNSGLSNSTLFMLKLNGTALLSLALENLQEVENLKLSRSDHDEAENMIAEALASLYAGQYLLQCENLIEIILVNSRVRFRKFMSK